MDLGTEQYEGLDRAGLIQLLERKERELSAYKACFSSGNTVNHTNNVVSDLVTILFKDDDRAMEHALDLLLAYFNVDCIYLAIFDDGTRTANFAYKAEVREVQLLRKNTTVLGYDEIPWIIKELREGNDVLFNDLSNMPPEASSEQALWKDTLLKSLLIAPLQLRNRVEGGIGFGTIGKSRTWCVSELKELHLVAGVFSIVVERWQSQRSGEEYRKRISELNTKFRQFFNNLPLGVELYDANGFMIDVNEADARIFGTSREQLLGINLFDNPNGTKELIALMTKGEPFSFPFTYRFAPVEDNKYYTTDQVLPEKYLRITGMGLKDRFGSIGFLVIVSDETEKQLKEEMLQNNLAILKAILLSGRSIVCEYDIDRKEFYANPLLNDSRSCKNKLFEYLFTHQSLTFGEFSALVGSEENVGKLYRVIDGKDDYCSFICKLPVDGNSIWIRFNALLYSSNKRNAGDKLICHLTDITEEKVLEERLHNAELETHRSELEVQKIKEADRLKSAFLANMSHEIRTPLNAIIGFSNILVETDDKEERKEFINIINKNNDLLLRLITDILDFSKIESGIQDYSVASANLKELCIGQCKMQALKMPEGVKLVCDFDALPDITLQTDSKRIMQVISNLLSNAAKFTEKGSVTLSVRLAGKSVRVEVADTGIGIPYEEQEKIFDRFVKLDSFSQGTGLGLPICKTIIEDLNGNIGVESQPGKGSCFWFTLPC